MYVCIPLWITHTKDFTPYTYVRVCEWINVNEKRSSFLPFLFIRDWFSFATMIKRKSTATPFHFFHIFLLPLLRKLFPGFSQFLLTELNFPVVSTEGMRRMKEKSVPMYTTRTVYYLKIIIKNGWMDVYSSPKKVCGREREREVKVEVG